jgi:hypothetical protein
MKWGSFFLGAMIVTSMFAGSFYGAWLANKSDVESLGYINQLVKHATR